MKMSKLLAALEDFEESPIPESVAAVADGNVVDAQPVGGAEAPVNEPGTIVDAGEVPAGIPAVSPLPVIDEPVVAEVAPVVPGAAEGENVIAEELPLEASGQLIIDSPMDHDNTMSMMDGDLVEQTAVSNDLGEIVEAHTALEEYSALLRQAGRDGITRQAAGFLRVGLEQFHADGHIDFSKEIASMEDMGDGNKQHLLPSKLDKDSLGSKLKEAAGKIWEWLKKIWEKSKNFINNLRNGVVGLERKLKAAEAAVGKNSNPKGEFTVPNPERLAVGSKVELNLPDSVKALTAMAGKVYPERMEQFYSAVASAVGNFDPAKSDASQVREMLVKAKSVLEDVSTSDVVLPGNVKIDVSESGISYGITEAGEGSAPSETKASVRSGSQIQSTLKDLRTILGTLKEYPARHEKMAAAAEKVGQALDRVKKASSAEGMEDGAAQVATDMESAVGKLLHEANPRGNEIIRYLARTASAYADVCLAEVGKADGKSKEVAVV